MIGKYGTERLPNTPVLSPARAPSPGVDYVSGQRAGSEPLDSIRQSLVNATCRPCQSWIWKAQLNELRKGLCVRFSTKAYGGESRSY